jgi:hypothetical protein
LRAAAQDFLDVRPETDVEHPVGLIEDHESNVAQQQRAAADQVDNPARRADDNFGAAAEMFDLLADRFTAVDAHNANIASQSEFDALIANLNGQFAGRHENQCLRIGGFRARLKLFENGDAKSGGFARARLRLAH